MATILWICLFIVSALLSHVGHSTKIHSDVIELNDKFLEVMNTGMWLVEVSIFDRYIIALFLSFIAHIVCTVNVWLLFGNT
jgi:hypothetical protein